jgi:alkaline phosphatase D
MHRRHFHQAALALALSAFGRSPAQGPTPAPRWPANPFALGVASGMPRPDSVVLWTRLAPGFEAFLPGSPGAAYEVRYEIYSDEALHQPVRSGMVLAQPGRAHSVHVLAAGLQPDRPYWYRFVCGTAVSPTGRTRTAPALNAQPARLRMALASCQHYEQGFYAAHGEIAAQNLDFVLFVGDYIYESSRGSGMPRKHAGEVPQTLDQYRQRHAQYKTDAQLQAAHAAHPWVLMWDDHEVVNDYADDLDQRYTDPAVFLRRRAAAYQAYLEHMPVMLPEMAGPGWGGPNVRMYDRYAWGQLAELWTLDCRQYRSHHACPDPFRAGGRVVLGCDELAQPQRTMLGVEQERWLQGGLASSTRAWKLLAQATQIAPSGVDSPLGRTTYTDAWDGYPEARTRLLRGVVDAGVKDVVTLGGDVHQNVAANLRLRPNDEKSPIVASEFVGTSVTSGGVREALLTTVRASNPDIAYARSDERGYTLLDVSPDAVRCTFRTTPHPAMADARLSTQASFVVERGQAGVKKA